MQNFGRFSITSDFDREYLRNGARYRKSERNVISSDSFRIRRKRSNELWSTTYREFHVSLNPLKCTFLADYISAHRGCCSLKFLHALEIGQALIAHTRSGMWVNFGDCWSTNKNVIARIDPPEVLVRTL